MLVQGILFIFIKVNNFITSEEFQFSHNKMFAHNFVLKLVMGQTLFFLNRSKLEPNFKLFFRTRTESNLAYTVQKNNLNACPIGDK
jgi:hypothetical protein